MWGLQAEGEGGGWGVSSAVQAIERAAWLLNKNCDYKLYACPYFTVFFKASDLEGG